jgi:hypothetical protein
MIKSGEVNEDRLTRPSLGGTMRRRKELITIEEGIEIAENMGVSISRPTVVKYATLIGYGYQIGSKWVIKKTEFRRFLNGKNRPTGKDKGYRASRLADQR